MSVEQSWCQLEGEPLILASASPRRAQMLTAAGIFFQVMPASIDEQAIHASSVQLLPEAIARAKAECLAQRFPQKLVLAADTIVCLEERVFGKPSTMDEAEWFLGVLSGKTHQVITGVALMRGDQAKVWHSRSDVTFRLLELPLIKEYLRLVNPLDKAGGYAIQEHGDMIIQSITGLKSNVIGLPIEEVLVCLGKGANHENHVES